MKKRLLYKHIQTFKRQEYSSNKTAMELEMRPRTAAKYYKMDKDDFRASWIEHLFHNRAFIEYKRDIMKVNEKNEFAKLNISSGYDYFEGIPKELVIYQDSLKARLFCMWLPKIMLLFQNQCPREIRKSLIIERQ